jgi:hypothetical protein
MPFQKYVPPVIPPLPRPYTCRFCKGGYGSSHSLYYHLIRTHRSEVSDTELGHVLDGMRREYQEGVAHKRAHEATWNRENKR